MSDKYKAWKKYYNRQRNRPGRRVHGGSGGDRYSTTPKFYQKEATKQHQRWFAKLMQGTLKKKG